ncbi:MAG: hypothetical protein QW063_02605, partial [Candidatus Nanoarchaeia archaeon]
EVTIDKRSGKMTINYKATEPVPKRVVERDLKKLYKSLISNQGFFSMQSSSPQTSYSPDLTTIAEAAAS